MCACVCVPPLLPPPLSLNTNLNVALCLRGWLEVERNHSLGHLHIAALDAPSSKRGRIVALAYSGNRKNKRWGGGKASMCLFWGPVFLFHEGGNT